MKESDAFQSLLEPDFAVKPRLRNNGFHCFILGVATVLCFASLTLAVYQVLFSREPVHVASEESVVNWPPPPPHELVAQVARYVVHTSEWGSIATISTVPALKSFPFANVVSLSDGPLRQSSGIPYMYMTAMDFTGKDLLTDARATLVVSQAQSDYCKGNHYDPEDPRCARIILSGQVTVLKNGTSEAKAAQTALFSRHPVMESWPAGHHWFFAKLNITNIYVLDFFGGAANVDVDEYFKADPFA